MEIIGKHKELTVHITKAKGVGVCDMGCVRTNNEDNMVLQKLWTDNYLLAVAIDGVGGQEGGEVAAAIAAESIPRFLETYRNGDPQELLCQAVQQANNDIFARREQDSKLAYMSCVLTAVLLDSRQGKAYMAHVGDSRLYLFSDGALRKLSHDHSLIGYREEQGDLTEEEAMHHPQRNIISRDVGSERHESTEFVESGAFDLYGDSILMLCSDGLCDMITSKEMVAILQRNDDIAERDKMLVDAAKSAGGRDNITVILVEHKSNKKQKSVTATDKKSGNVGHNHSTDNVVQTENDGDNQSQQLPNDNNADDAAGQKAPTVHKRIWLVILAAIAALAIGFAAGWLCFADKEPEKVDVTSPATAVKTSAMKPPFVSEKRTVEDFNTAKGLSTGSMEVLSLSQVADLFEYNCYNSIANPLKDSLNIIATSHETHYLKPVKIGQEVWCECQLVSKDSNCYTFSSKLLTEQGVMAQGECIFSLITE